MTASSITPVQQLTAPQQAWCDRVRVLYEAEGIAGAVYSWCEPEDGLLVDWGDVEAVHSEGDPDIEHVVASMARIMRSGPLSLVEA